jgi:hypothetical protein
VARGGGHSTFNGVYTGIEPDVRDILNGVEDVVVGGGNRKKKEKRKGRKEMTDRDRQIITTIIKKKEKSRLIGSLDD